MRDERESVPEPEVPTESAPAEEVVAKLCLTRFSAGPEVALVLDPAYGAVGGAFAKVGSTIPSMSSRFMSR